MFLFFQGGQKAVGSNLAFGGPQMRWPPTRDGAMASTMPASRNPWRMVIHFSPESRRHVEQVPVRAPRSLAHRGTSSWCPMRTALEAAQLRGWVFHLGRSSGSLSLKLLGAPGLTIRNRKLLGAPGRKWMAQCLPRRVIHRAPYQPPMGLCHFSLFQHCKSIP